MEIAISMKIGFPYYFQLRSQPRTQALSREEPGNEVAKIHTISIVRILKNPLVIRMNRLGLDCL